MVTAWENPVGQFGWQKLTEDPPWEPHTGSIATALSDGSMLLIAGQAGRHGGATFDCFNCTNDVWHFQQSTSSWKELTQDAPWDPRWGHSVITTPDDTVWMFFGCCERGKPTVMLQDVWTINPTKGQAWAKIDTAPPFEGVQATSVALQGASNMWFAGGWSQSRGTLSLVALFDASTHKWIMKSKNEDAPWDTRADHGSAISPDGKWLFIFGGQHCKDSGRYWERKGDTWKIALEDCSGPDGCHPSSWKQLGDLTAPRSSPAMMVMPTGWLLTLGGHWTPETEELGEAEKEAEGLKKHHEETDFHAYGDVHALNMNNGGDDGWKLLEKQAPWPGRDDCAASVTSDGTILIFGGGTLYGGGGYHRDVWRLPNAASQYGLKSAAGKGKGDEL